MHETLWEMHRTQDQFIAQVDLLTQKIIELQNTLLMQQHHGYIPLQHPVCVPLTQSTSSSALLHLPVPQGSASQFDNANLPLVP